MIDSSDAHLTAIARYAPASLRVLLFEDNAMDAALIKRFLRTVGVPAGQIHLADTIPSALQILTRERVDLCLTDYHLRPHTGFDLMEEARRSDVDVPFIVVTALDDRSIDDGALAHGAYDFLIKGEMTVEGLERSIRYTLARHARESELARAAYVDVLTGLPNRASFLDRLTQAVKDNSARGGMVGAAIFNLNGTKFINEAFGQGIGDDVLRCVGQRIITTRDALPLEQGAAAPRCMIARIGGDEFGVVMTDFLLASQALAAARHIAEGVTGAVDTRDGKHVITVAGGVAAHAMSKGAVSPAKKTQRPASARDIAERLLQQAAQAMLTAKQTARLNGRSHVAMMHIH